MGRKSQLLSDRGLSGPSRSSSTGFIGSPRRRTIACNVAGGRAGFEVAAFRVGPLMRSVLPTMLPNPKEQFNES
jgi:hypothetical protein